MGVADGYPHLGFNKQGESEVELELHEREYKRISKLVFGISGINLHDGKQHLIHGRLAKRLRELGLKNFKEYCNILENDTTGLEVTVLIDRLSTNKTDFFREEAHFEFMKSRALPELQERKKSGRRGKIRIWSAGCSSGEEPCTIAITIVEKLGITAGYDISILATDISTRMLARAQMGVYPESAMGGMPKYYRMKYFHKAGDGEYRVSQTVSGLITYARLNLMDKWPMRGPFDFIFCRNVMIYFTKETQKDLIKRFYGLIPPGGYLFLGHSESLSNMKHGFKNVQPAVYAKPGIKDRESKCRR